MLVVVSYRLPEPHSSAAISGLYWVSRSQNGLRMAMESREEMG